MSRHFEVRLSAQGEIVICDEDSGYEAKLHLAGDFGSPQRRWEYAHSIANALNAAPIPTPDFSRFEADGSLRDERLRSLTGRASRQDLPGAA